MEKPIEEVGLTFRTAIICIFAIALCFFLNLQHWGFLGLEAGLVGHIGAAMHHSYGVLMIYTLLVLVLSTKLHRRIFTPSELAIFAAIFYMVGDFPYSLNRIMPWLLNPYVASDTPFFQFIPTYWSPDKEVLAGAFLGGQPVPWGTLAPYIAYWTIMIAFSFLITFFVVSLFAKPFVEVERLPFPFAVPVSQFFKYATGVTGGSEGKSLLKRFPKVLWIGFIFGIIISLPITMNYIYPFYESFFVWGQIFITPLAEWQWSGVLNVPDWPMFIPADVAILYFCPMDVLHTAFLANIIFLWIYPIVATTSGMAAPGTFPTETYIYPMSYYGIPIGLALWSIFRHGGYLKDTLISAVKGRRADKGDIPPTWLVWGLVLSFIVWIALNSSTGVPVPLAFVGTIVFAILSLGSARLVAELGIWPGSPGCVYGDFTRRSVWATGQALGYFPAIAPVNSKEAFATFAMTEFNMSPDQEWASGGWGMLENFGLANQTKTTLRDMFKGQIFGIVVGSLLLYPIALWLFYTYGLQAQLPSGFYYGPLREGVKTIPYVTYDAGQYSMTEITMITIGAALVFIISILRMRFPWLFLHAVGLGAAWSNMFTLAIVPAWILKFVTLKIGGSKAYEEVGLPSVTGFLFGLGLGATLGMLGLALRYIAGAGAPVA